MINLAADYGWGPGTLLLLFLICIVTTVIGIIVVMTTTSYRFKVQGFASKTRHHPETYWAIGVALLLIYLWAASYPWMPPVAFSSANKDMSSHDHSDKVKVVNISAGQWFWLMNMQNSGPLKAGQSPYITVTAGQTIKFVARSVDVNHGFGVFAGPTDGSQLMFQMQAVPGVDNVFLFTFKHPGIYLVRCLEYCGYAHPYMTSQIKVVSSSPSSNLPT
jgi:heme/copper-type cytochrome/quinol oxidase subunit 2